MVRYWHFNVTPPPPHLDQDRQHPVQVWFVLQSSKAKNIEIVMLNTIELSESGMCWLIKKPDIMALTKTTRRHLGWGLQSACCRISSHLFCIGSALMMAVRCMEQRSLGKRFLDCSNNSGPLLAKWEYTKIWQFRILSLFCLSSAHCVNARDLSAPFETGHVLNGHVSLRILTILRPVTSSGFAQTRAPPRRNLQ